MGKEFSPGPDPLPMGFFPCVEPGNAVGEMTEVRCLLWVFPHASRNPGIAAAPTSSHQGAGPAFPQAGMGSREDAVPGFGAPPGLYNLPPRCCWTLLGLPFPPKTPFWCFFPRLAPAGRSCTGSAPLPSPFLSSRPSGELLPGAAGIVPVLCPVLPLSLVPSHRGEHFGVGCCGRRAESHGRDSGILLGLCLRADIGSSIGVCRDR